MYFKTMLTYFASIEKPSEALLKLKLKELILSILESSNNPELKEYFLRLHENQEPLLSEIMENNFRYNLTLENYAEMCHKSLSSFKRDFYNQYHTAPGKWLLNKRLEYSAALLKSGNLSISEAAFESGFENLSHFSQAFSNKFGLAPLRFKKQHYSVLLDKS
jgi:AraC-like DNA-binding protein